MGRPRKISLSNAQKEEEFDGEDLMENGFDDDQSENSYETKHASLEETLERIKKDANADIFVDLGESLRQHSVFIRYFIKRNGSFVAEKQHPYSWAQLKKEFGPGHYTIQARHPSKGSVLKTQSLEIAENFMPQIPLVEEEEPVKVAQSIPHPGSDMTSLMGIMMQQNAELVKALASNRPQTPVQNDNTPLLIQMMQANQENTMKMFQQMQEHNQKVNADNLKMTSMMFDKINEKMERSTKKDPYTDVAQLMLLMQQGRNEGLEMMERIEEAAEKRAARLVEQDKGDTGSLVDKIAGYAPKILELAMKTQAPQQKAQRPIQRPQRPIQKSPNQITQNNSVEKTQTKGQSVIVGGFDFGSDVNDSPQISHNVESEPENVFLKKLDPLFVKLTLTSEENWKTESIKWLEETNFDAADFVSKVSMSDILKLLQDYPENYQGLAKDIYAYLRSKSGLENSSS
jgi:hypothetical protein